MNVYLRALEIGDYEMINKWRNDEEIYKFLAGNRYMVSPEREKKWVEEKVFNDRNDLYFAICLKQNSKFIGYCSINNIDLRNSKAEWGGTIIGDTNERGKGYAKESVLLMLKYLFNEYPINKCYGYCLEEHLVTENLLKKLGFKKDGILREEVFKSGEYKNLLIYSILRKEIKF